MIFNVEPPKKIEEKEDTNNPLLDLIDFCKKIENTYVVLGRDKPLDPEMMFRKVILGRKK